MCEQLYLTLARDSDGIKGAITELNRTYGYSYRQISTMGVFKGIPHGTIRNIGAGGDIPKHWRSQLIAPKPTDRIAISKSSMESAARTLRNNLTPAQVSTLAWLLQGGWIDMEAEDEID